MAIADYTSLRFRVVLYPMSAIKLLIQAKRHIAHLVSDLKSANSQFAQMADHYSRFAPVETYEKLLATDDFWEASLREPIRISFNLGAWDNKDQRFLTDQFVFQDCLWTTKGLFTEAQDKLLIMDAFDAERRKFERLEHKFSKNGETKKSRPSIPELVRIEVWRRDEGACATCGSKELLEYDHIIPISKGGSNTARNVELLCEKCNRTKSNKIQ